MIDDIGSKISVVLRGKNIDIVSFCQWGNEIGVVATSVVGLIKYN